MTTIRPSEVCRLIQRDHNASRTRMDELWSAVSTLKAGEAKALQSVMLLSRVLHDELKEHIELEHEILVPALRETDAWGDLRADKLTHRLDVRLQELTTLRDSRSFGDPRAIASELRGFIEDRWTDMAHSERLVLSSGVLRDDVLGIDVDAG